jgi:ABC-type polysaccharide/polyol phosphate export permease
MHAPVSSARIYTGSPARPASMDLLAAAIAEIVSRGRLIRHLATAVNRKTGTDTLLGNVWWVLDPLLQMPLYVLLVGVVLRSGTADYPLFVFAAILPWKWFTTSVADATASVTSQDALIKQVPFPKVVLPVATVAAGVPQFLFGLLPLLALMLLFYRERLSPFLLLLPVVAGVQLLLTLAAGTLLAALNVFARDTGRLAMHVLRLWFFLSPGLYATDRIDRVMARHPAVGYLFRVNPFTTLFEAYRDLIYRARFPDPAALGALLVVSSCALALTLVAFKRLEPRFAKVL